MLMLSGWQNFKKSVFTVHPKTAYRESKRIPLAVLNFGSRWSWQVNITLRPVCPRGKNTDTHWIGGLLRHKVGGMQVLEKIKPPFLPEIENRIFQLAVRSNDCIIPMSVV